MILQSYVSKFEYDLEHFLQIALELVQGRLLKWLPLISLHVQVYLPQETPTGLKELREQELINMRGNGKGLRKEADRIYDYAVYNDLGDIELHESFKRPVLGGNDKFPYPRRMRTGRPLSELGGTSFNRKLMMISAISDAKISSKSPTI